MRPHVDHGPGEVAPDAELAALYRAQADVMELIRLSQEAIDRSKELITQTDAVLAKSPFKP
jgi:hypothetical protein